jgi:hypothetical protein
LVAAVLPVGVEPTCLSATGLQSVILI